MVASLLMVTMDRFNVTPSCWAENLKAARHNLDPAISLELLVCDNGSKDRRIVAYMEQQTLHYHRINMRNEGVGKAFNQLFLRSTGKFIAILGNDISMPAGWLNAAIKMLTWTPQAGIMGYDWGHGHTPPLTKRFGLEAHWLNEKLNRVFGSWVFRRDTAEQMGLFHEGYGPYGIEDSDVNERWNRAGYQSCYLPMLKSRHLVCDVGENTEYRKMKDESLSRNCGIFGERLGEWDRGTLSLREPLPPLREPLT